jgi:RNA polymerase sigma-B factor
MQPTPLPAERRAAKHVRDRRDRILIRRYAATKDPRLREQLIERFMPLARSLAMRYRNGSEPLDDLIQVASEGLVRAVDGFDPERRTNFSSYATPVILGALRHYFRDGTQAVHLPRGLQERVARVNSIADEIRAAKGRTPSVTEIATEYGDDREAVLEAMEADARRSPMSIDQPARVDDVDGMPPLAETIPTTEPGFERTESTLAGQTAELQDREWRALELRYGHDLTQREIGEEIGVSQMQVSRILRRSLNELLGAVQGEERVAA